MAGSQIECTVPHDGEGMTNALRQEHEVAGTGAYGMAPSHLIIHILV